VKNTLTRLAAQQAGADALLVLLEGPTAIAFIESQGDPAAVAKALAQTARETNVLALRGGILEGKTLSAAEVAQLATLPPVDVLRGQLVGAIVAPVTQLMALLEAPLRDLHGLVEARIEQLEEQGEVVEPPAGEEAATEDVATDETEAQDTPAGSASAEPAAQEETEEPEAQEGTEEE